MDTPPAVLERLRKGLESKYRIERELGRGGMATVFLAQDLVHQRPVAIKVLHPEIATGFSTARFLREIRLLATLQHPNILPLYDSGEIDGLPYFVMPFVSGESLRDRITRDGSVPVALSIRLACEAAAALDYAHRQGVVHRDIKPENILLSDDHVIIADFGIARAAAQSQDERLTGTSVTIGTPAYMSPEQAAGDENIDGRSDIYSLACVMFEMLSGQTPFTGSTPAAVIASRFARPAPRISSITAEIPKAIDSALASALSLSPDDRPGAAAEFAALLFRNDVPDSKSKFGLRNGAIAAALIVIAGVAIFYRSNIGTGNQAAALANDPVKRVSHTIDPEAHTLYLQGRKALEGIFPGSLDTAIKYFDSAIRRDSLYAEAWAGLADAHTSRGVGNLVSVPPRAEFEQGRFAATRAVTLDSTLAEAHTALAIVQMMYDYDWEAASQSLDKARALDPGWSVTYLYRSFLLTWLAKYDSATTVARETGRMNPDDFRARQDYGRTLILARRFGEAEKVIRKDISTQPDNFRLKVLLGDALIADGKYADAIRALDSAQQISPGTIRTEAFRIAAYARGGEEKRARAGVDSLVNLSDTRFVPALDIAIAYAGLRDTDQTLAWLERGFDDRTLRPLIRDPMFDFVKDHPRFRALLEKMNLRD